MCGIAGILSTSGGPPPTLEELRRMAGALTHRGPDSFGVYRDDRAGLAHSRLSIIDHAGGQQPLANEDESLWIAFNGEIYNYVELREELRALGHSFRTKSDTEVLVHAFQAWGNDAFARLNGQFAVALWNSQTGVLTLARDPMGIRPLYFCEHEGRLYFGSEVKAIFAASSSIPRGFDPVGLLQTFTFWGAQAPRSVFGGVEEIPPGTYRTIDVRGASVTTGEHWHPPYPTGPEGAFTGSFAEACEAVREALEEATRLRMLRADVAVASYVSGGIDSTIIAGMGKQAIGGNLKTFSLRFADAEFDEADYQRLVVERLESEHHHIEVHRRDIAEAFPDVIAHTERPLMRTGPAPLFLLSKLVRDNGIKVVLTGEGADEVFAGYDIFRLGKVRRFWAKEPSSTSRPRLLEKLYPYLARSPVAQRAMTRKFFGRGIDDPDGVTPTHFTRWHGSSTVRRILAGPMREAIRDTDVVAELLADLPAPFATWTPLAQEQYLEKRTLLAPYILSSQGDRMLMAHSVEGRFPFLDPNVMRVAASLPDTYKLKVLDEKHVLKHATRDLVPAPIISRKKQAYRAPDAMAFANLDEDAPDWIDAAISEDALREAGVFDPAFAQRLWQKCRKSKGQMSNSDNMALIAVLSTQLLHHTMVQDGSRTTSLPELGTVIDRTSNP